MAGTTLDFYMHPFQRKIGQVVIERFWEPATGNMASCTVSYAINSKGFVMFILMTGNALCIQVSEFLAGISLIISIFDEMTFPTRYLGMFTAQGPFGLFMVKINGRPSVIDMTGITIILWVIFFTDIALVNVLVAINASLA
jgi:hypothetical protein